MTKLLIVAYHRPRLNNRFPTLQLQGKYRYVLLLYLFSLLLKCESLTTSGCELPREELEESAPLDFKEKKLRNFLAFWILGLCNNYVYAVMVSAAKDILHTQSDDNHDIQGHQTERDYNYMSTGAILLASILPCLCIKLIAPLLPFYVHVRVGACFVFTASGLLLVAFSESQFMSIFGVIVISISSGLGEVTYLQYSLSYHKNVVSSWSSGTGSAGVLGALSYAALNKLIIRNALLTMLVAPVLMAVTFWAILQKPHEKHHINQEKISNPVESFKKKLYRLPGLMRFMLPLGLVYLFD